MQKIISITGKVILILTLLVTTLFMTTGCEQEINAEEKIKKAMQRMNEINEYLATITFNYSDEEQNINGTFVSNINTTNASDDFDGKINYNGEIFTTNGVKDANGFIIKNIEGKPVKVNIPIIRVKDLKITNIREIKDRSGNKDFTYLIGTINDKYEAKFGIGEDDVIYSIDINLKNDSDSDKLVSVYEIKVEISDSFKAVTPSNFTGEIPEVNDFFDIFISTDEIGGGVE